MASPRTFKYYLTLASIIIAIILGVLTLRDDIQRWFKPQYKLEAYIQSIEAPLPFRITNELKDLGSFSVEDIRRRHKDTPEVKEVPDAVLQEALPAYSKIIRQRADLILDDIFRLGERHLTVVTIRNTGWETLTGVEIKSPYSFKQIAQIEWDNGNRIDQEFFRAISLGNLTPRSEVKLFIYSAFPSTSLTVVHDKGVGRITHYAPVPALVMQAGGGVWISYYWTTVILFALLLLILIFLIPYSILQRKRRRQQTQ